MATITLNSTGPSPTPLSATPGEAITIINNLDYEVTLDLDPAGLFNPSTGSSLDVPTTGWSGTIGAAKGTRGTYTYEDRKREPRSGTVDVN